MPQSEGRVHSFSCDPPLPCPPWHPHHTQLCLLCCPRGAHHRWRKAHPQTAWSHFRFPALFPPIPCVCCIPFLYRPSSAQFILSHLSSQRPCFFFMEPLERRGETSSNWLTHLPQGLCSLLSTDCEVCPCSWLRLTLRLCPCCHLHSVSGRRGILPPLHHVFDFLKNLFIYSFNFWLQWVFAAARGFSLVAVSRGYSSLRGAGFSLRWFLLLQSTGSRRAGFSSCGTWASVVVARGL